MTSTPVALVDSKAGRPPVRWHRFLTVPALAVAMIVMLGHRFFLLALLVFPPTIAMPWLIAAALRPTARAIENAHTAVRSTSHIMCAVGVLAVIWVLPQLDSVGSFAPGGILIGTSAVLLLAAGYEPRERRLGLVLVLMGLAQAGAMVILMWLTPHAALLLPAGALMVIGGVLWHAEASFAPGVETNLPHAIVRC